MNPVVLSLHQISLTLGGERVLDGVDFDLRRGEVHGVAGANGSGKSSLGRVIHGSLVPGAGQIRVDGQVQRFARPGDALGQRIAMAYQETSLVADLSVAENLWLARHPHLRGWLVDPVRARAEAEALLGRLAFPGAPGPGDPVWTLNQAQRRFIEIAKALASGPRILVLDEPGAAFDDEGRRWLAAQIDRLRDEGTSIVYISHALDDLAAAADRVTVLAQGRVSGTWVRGTPGLEALVAGSSGAVVEPRRRRTPGAPVLTLEGVVVGRRPPVSLSVRRGEAVGLAGRAGSGRSTLLKALFGLVPLGEGRVLVDGKPVRLRSPRTALAQGLVLVPEDRRTEGLVLDFTARENVWLGLVRGLVRRPAKRVGDLSGGTQQRVLWAKALARDGRVLLLDDPTRGLDTSARRRVLAQLDDFLDTGGAVLMASSDPQELEAWCDRLYSLDEGVLVR